MSHPTDDHESPHWVKARLAGLVWRITPTCREVARRTSEERDHPLPVGLRLRLGLHRHFCPSCARYAGQLDLLHEATRQFPGHLHEAGGPTLSTEAKARLKRALREQPNEESWRSRTD